MYSESSPFSCSSQCQARVPWCLQWTLVSYCYKTNKVCLYICIYPFYRLHCFSEDVLPSIHADPEYPCELVGTWNTWYGEQDQAGKSPEACGIGHISKRLACIWPKKRTLHSLKSIKNFERMQMSKLYLTLTAHDSLGLWPHLWFS